MKQHCWKSPDITNGIRRKGTELFNLVHYKERSPYGLPYPVFCAHEIKFQGRVDGKFVFPARLYTI
jgi:hypothetical protein